MTPRRALLTALVVCLATTTPARAAPAPDPGASEGPRADVAVLRPASDDAVLVEASARLRLELGADGSTSALVEGGDSFAARVALVRVDGVVMIDVLGTPAAGATLHRRVSVSPEEGGDDPAVIAVRAVELLRALRLEIRRPPAPVIARAAAAEPGAEPPAAREPEHATWRFEAGVGVLGARPLGATLGIGPALAAAGAIAPHVSFTAAFAGPFYTDRPATIDGSAHTREELGGIGLRVETWRERVNVHALATVGLHHLTAVYDARGVAGLPIGLHGITPQSSWNPAIMLAAGASVRAWRHVGVSLQLAAILVEPALEIVSNGHSVGTFGAPSLMPTLSAWTTL